MKKYFELPWKERRELLRKILQRTEPGPDSCRSWTGPIDYAGYPLVYIAGNSWRGARVSWELYHGRSIPENWDAHHTCFFRLCVNPKHIKPLPHGEHMHIHALAGSWNGEHCSSLGLTEEDILEIRRLRAAGTPVKRLAGIWRMSLRNCYKIVNRESWRHV